jgi:arsenate reductase
MAEGFLRSIGPELEVFSAGTHPAKEVNPNSIIVMKEIDIDITSQFPKDVSIYVKDSFDYVITVCDNAKESCPVFTGNVKKQLHLGFVDPAEAKGSKEKILNEYREIRDEIRSAFRHLYETKLKD